jgi:hypothetical protein
VIAEHLDQFLGAGPYARPSGHVQKRGVEPAWMVMPSHHPTEFEPLVRELDKRFARRTVVGLVVYRLR